MPLPFSSALIRYRRLEKNWSQEGLCEGICAVSYLSKIEQGKAEPGAEILARLMERLGVAWQENLRAGTLEEELQEALFSVDQDAQERCYAELEQTREKWMQSPQMLELLLLEKLCPQNRETGEETVPLTAFEECFSERQRGLWLMGEKRFEEALAYIPEAFVYLECGWQAYRRGDYAKAVEKLLKADALAAQEGRARIMLLARVWLGNCSSAQLDEDGMERHYRTAERLAKDLGEFAILKDLHYNRAATQMTLGRYDEAYAYFAAVADPCNMDLHKLAICLEKQGRAQEAMDVLDRVSAARADWPDPKEDELEHKWIESMCELVRFRLEHADYLRRPEYGDRLISLFEEMQGELPHGFVLFHLPWVEEWYTASRQYKQAYELKKQFS